VEPPFDKNTLRLEADLHVILADFNGHLSGNVLIMSLINRRQNFKQNIHLRMAGLSGFCNDMTSELTSVAGAWFLVQIP
jgi:hypothetical protein